MFDANEAEIRPCKSFEWDTKTVAHGTSCSIRAKHVVRCHKRFAFGTHEEGWDFFVRLLTPANLWEKRTLMFGYLEICSRMIAAKPCCPRNTISRSPSEPSIPCNSARSSC